MNSNLAHLPYPDGLPAASRQVRTGRLRRLPDVLTISSIVVLVVLVSMPRLRAFVVRANESDARTTMMVLGERLQSHDGEPRSLSALLADDTEMSRQFQDALLQREGRRLRFHGFFYELTRDAAGVPWIVGWPVAAGRTGVRAYVLQGARPAGADGPGGGPGGGPGNGPHARDGLNDANAWGTLWLHPNAEETWSGEDGAPGLPQPGAGWLRCR